MGALLLALLKTIGTAAVKGAAGVGKAALTGAKAVGKGAVDAGKWYWNRTQQGAGLDKSDDLTKLAQAFSSMITPSAEASDSQRIESGNIVAPGPGGQLIQGEGDVISDYKLRAPDYKIPSAYKQMTVQPAPQQTPPVMQFVPGPDGSVIGGQGEVMPGYGMESPSSRIPPAYQKIVQQNLSEPYPGFFAGLKEGILGIPSSAGEPQPSEKGRQTAYYAGKLIPDIMRSKMGVSTTREEAKQQAYEEAYGKKDYPSEFSSEVEGALDAAKTEDERLFVYQKLAAKYPRFSNELKRIFFPKSQSQGLDLETLAALFNQGR